MLMSHLYLIFCEILFVLLICSVLLFHKNIFKTNIWYTNHLPFVYVAKKVAFIVFFKINILQYNFFLMASLFSKSENYSIVHSKSWIFLSSVIRIQNRSFSLQCQVKIQFQFFTYG